MGIQTEAVPAASVTRDAPSPAAPSDVRQRWLSDAADCVRRNGVVIIRDAIPAARIASIHADFAVRHDVHMTPDQKKLYHRFQPDPLRAQVPIAVDGPIADPAVFAPPSVLAVVQELMGADLIIGEMGVVISHPGAGAQTPHRDSEFLFGGLDMEVALPPFAMTMLVPLIDVALDMGPTEYWPGSHREFDKDAVVATPASRAALDAGSVVLLDSRVVHGGGANISTSVRPTVYFSFHRRWYVENPGYEKKPQVRVTPLMLQRLPERYRPLFSWALHLNRTDSFQEFVYRWIGRIRLRVARLLG